jgi:methionyl aminopeptidase
MTKGLLVNLKNDDWLAKQKLAGRVVSAIFKDCALLIKNKTPNLKLKEFEQIAQRQIRLSDCEPSFLNYRGFPSVICTSVNNTLVHGIPSDYILQNGDVLKLDVGVTYQGAIADAAFTFIYGTPKSEEHVKLVCACQNALNQAVKSISVGKRLGSIGAVIRKNSNGFGVINRYGGHGLDWNILHADPFVSNDGHDNEGIRIQTGLSIAIEPMLVIGKNIETTVAADNWAVLTNDIGAHFEHSVTVDFNGQVHIITEHFLNAIDYIEV